MRNVKPTVSRGVALATVCLVAIAAACSDRPAARRQQGVRLDRTVPPVSRDALLVTGEKERVSSDNALLRALELGGFAVDVTDAASVALETVSDRSLVVVSQTVTSAPAALAESVAPVVVLSRSAAIDLGLGAVGFDPERGKSVTVIGGSALAAGLDGHVSLYKSLRPVGAVEAAPSAITVAHRIGEPRKAVLFAYERGARTARGAAPARRVGFLASFAVPGAVTPEGEALLAAALQWAARPRAVLVADPASSEPGDALVAERLRAMGLDVRLLDPAVRKLPPARTSDAWLVSTTAAAAALAPDLAELAAPMLVAQPELFQPLGMVAGAADSGFVPDGTRVTLPSASHALAAGLTGEVPVVTRPARLAWGAPLPSAVFAAEVAQGKAGIFAYEAAAIPRSGSDQNVATRGRRLGWLGTPEAFAAMTRGGWALFDAAVGWLRRAPGAAEPQPLQACLGLPAEASGGGSAGDGRTRVAITRGVQTALEGGRKTIDLGGPSVLEVPATLAPVIGDPNAIVELTFSGTACRRSQADAPDAWTAVGGGDVTCRYRLASSGASVTIFPQSALVQCTGGVVAYDQLVATALEVEIVGSPQAAVASIDVPGPNSGYLDDPMSPEETYAVRAGFDWSATQPVPETNADGHPTVWYALVYLRSDANREALRRLDLFHRPLPLFAHELERWRGRQGFIRHRGDGTGAFVYALVPGAVYNAIRSYALQGHPIFDAVVLQETPSYARDALGAITYDQVANAYPERAAAAPTALRRAQAALTDGDVLEAVADLARAVKYLLMEGVGEVAKWDEGSVTMQIVTDLRNADPGFGGSLSQATIHSDPTTPMVRPWSADGSAVTLSHVPVMLIGDYSVLGLPMMFSGETSASGVASIDVAIGQAVSICFEIENDAVELRETFLPIEYCHFVGTSAYEGMGAFQVAIQNGYFNILAQGAEARQFLQATIGNAPGKTKIITGDLVDWFTRVNGGSQAFVPCFTYGQGTFINVLFATGTVATMTALSWCPPLAIGAGLTLEGYRATLAQNDMFVLGAPNSDAAISRGVFSHEYGHLALCKMIDETGSEAYEGAVMARMLHDTERDNEPGYLNEAWADFFASQLVGGVDYFYLDGMVEAAPMFYAAGRGSDLDTNASDAGTFDDQIARITTMLHDAFDRDPPYTSGFHSGTPWAQLGSRLVHASPWNRATFGDEAIALPAEVLPDLIGASALGSLSEASLVFTLDLLSALAGYDACQRCELYAQHRPGGPTTGKGEMWEFCRTTEINDWMIEGMPDPADPASCNYQPPPCTPVYACIDGDGDGYYWCDDASPARQRCQEDLAGGWVPKTSGMPWEPTWCNADAARHPDAALVCGQDANCDGSADKAQGWSCTGVDGDEWTVEDGGWVSTACGSQRGDRKCNIDTGCIQTVTLPTARIWTGSSSVFHHRSDCEGYASGDHYVIPAQHDTCWAQYGPYMNNLASGAYNVGFLVDAYGHGAYATFDVARSLGTVIKSTGKVEIEGDAGHACYVVWDVGLGTCDQLEFRVEYNSASWRETAHTLVILGTAVVPGDQDPCTPLCTAHGCP
ncbi:MAG TPA: hypothetical protein VFL83_04710 [Anaeromyxobacter sp.]|nr:hypothetical protein [Anaeromyxobacter sp.]